MTEALLKVLHRFKAIFYPIAAVTLVMILMVITRVTVSAANDIPTGDSFTSVTGSDYYVSAQNVKAGAGEDFEVIVTTSGDQYRETQIWQTEMYFTYNFKVLSGAYNQYCTGDLLISDTISCSFTVGNSWTSDNYRYSISIIDQSGDFNVSMYNNGNGYQFQISFVDLYTNSNEGFSFTCVCKAQGRSYVNAQNSYVQAYAPTVTLNHSLAISGTSGFVASGDSKLHDQIVNAISDSTEVQGILANLGYIFNSLGIIDNRLTSMLAQDSAFHAAAISELGDINDATTDSYGRTVIGTLVDIYEFLEQDIKNVSTTEMTNANNQIASTSTTEAQLQQGFTGVLNGLDTGNMDFDSGLAEIDRAHPSAFITNNAVSFEFWKTVGDDCLTRNTSVGLGSIAGFLMIVLILGFTAWVLHL